MERKKIGATGDRASQSCGAQALEREVLARNERGELSFCAGCDRFTLDVGGLRLTLSARRLLELTRLIASELGRVDSGTRTSVRLSSEAALRLDHAGLSALDELLAAAAPRAAQLTARQASRSSSPHTVH